MKDYILTIGIDKFYLTKKERDFYLKSVDSGAKYVEIDGNIFGTTFQSLVNKNSLGGKWECDYGQWHTNGSVCYCDGQWVMNDSGRVEFIENSNKELLINSKE